MSNQENIKYRNFKYTKNIENKLKYELNDDEKKSLNIIYKKLECYNNTITSPYIVEDIFKLVYVYKLPTIVLSEIYGVGVRSIQLWKKELMLSKKDLEKDNEYKSKTNEFDDFKKKCKKSNCKFIGEKYYKWTIVDIDYCKSFINGKTHFICKCDCIYNTVKSVVKNNILQGLSMSCGCGIPSTNLLSDNYDIKSKNYCLYRFLDKYNKVLYIGKCERSFHSNGRNGLKEYFLKDRLLQHYSPSSKQMPKSLYLNTRYIEVSFPNVKNNEELEKLESQLISYYEREKFQCNYNLNLLSYVEYITEDRQKWILYDEKTDKDIDNLLYAYKMNSIPPIETINERLKAMVWLKNKKYNVV